MPVEVTYDADGVQSIRALDKPPAGQGEYGEPCYSCDCCRKWAETLELLRAHVLAHNARVPALLPCPGECLVCQAGTDGGQVFGHG